MNDELLRSQALALVEHMANYLEAVENLKADEAKIANMYQLPGGEIKAGLDDALKKYRESWLSAWGVYGTRNMAFVRRHAIESSSKFISENNSKNSFYEQLNNQ
jgi:hypothetical protein